MHAELNAILFSRERLDGCTLYTIPMPPCDRCAAAIIQSGISKVVFPNSRGSGALVGPVSRLERESDVR